MTHQLARSAFLGRDETEYCRLLLERFNYLTDLRTMTSHRHITLIGVVGAFVAGVFQFGGPEGQALVARILVPAAAILLLLGACVTVYDAMILHRAGAVVHEISRLVKASELPAVQGERRGRISWMLRVFDEDFFFFSQILIVNSLTAVLLAMKTAHTGTLGLTVGLSGVYAFFVGALGFSLLWFGARAGYARWGPPNRWFPRA